MRQSLLLLIPVLLPIVAGILVLTVKRVCRERKLMLGISLAALLVVLVICIVIAFQPGGGLDLWQLTDTITIAFHVNNVSRLFSLLTCFVWLMTGMFSMECMKHERDEFRFFGLYLIMLGVLIGLDYAADLITLYVFYGMVTLTSLPLVLHELTKGVVMTGLKCLYYSVADAFLALFGIFVIAHYATALTFTPSGVLDGTALAGHEGPLSVIVFCMIVGPGTKADIFPMHGWLPTAHPVAPTPASAILSDLITKAGILGIMRVISFMVGPDLIRGTWVQTAWMILALLTVFTGSMLAYKEPVMKRRLAYSTVSQVSYMMFSLSLLTPLGMVGAFSHVIFHPLVKSTLLLGAGAVIYKIGLKKISELRGIGKRMPITIWCFTLVSLTLVGTPPTSGFVGKWYLATGALAADVGTFSWIDPVMLLISVLLTAGYLLPVTIYEFFPGADYDYGNVKELEPSLWMLVPILLTIAGVAVFGTFPAPLTRFIETIVSAVI